MAAQQAAHRKIKSFKNPMLAQGFYWLNRETGLRNRGVLVRNRLYVLRKTQMPAVLVELGFITNYNDAMLMLNSPELFADGIYNGIINYLGL